MAISQLRSNRKKTGGRYKRIKGKKKAYNGSLPAMTRIGPISARVRRVLGGNVKPRLLCTDTVNVADNGKVSKDSVVSVLENTANRNYIRRNVLTKGAVVELKSGKKAIITSRPGQSKVLNAKVIA